MPPVGVGVPQEAAGRFTRYRSPLAPWGDASGTTVCARTNCATRPSAG